MAGLKICTRWRAYSARRKRRISSSLFPENIGPTTTSIQPMLPLTMSTRALLFAPRLSAGCGRRTAVLSGIVRSCVVKRCKGDSGGQAKRFGAGDEVCGKHAPCALAIAYTGLSGKLIDSYGQFRAMQQNFVGQRVRQLDCSGRAEIAAAAVGDISPALQEYAANIVFIGDIEATFEAHIEVGAFVSGFQGTDERFRPLACTAHQLLPGGGRVGDAAFHFTAKYLQNGVGAEHL